MENIIAQHWHIYQPRANDFWTEKINEECYKPNSKNGVFNYVSFNIGPTLIEWFENNDPETLQRIVEKDKGQIFAQSYNHRILPLIRYPKDLELQIYWGKEHFKKYFNRDPKGMWLPETATNSDVLRELARQGIEYTIGTQYQNKSGNPGVYKIDLENDLEITYFFYDAISGKVAFNEDHILDNADNAAEFFLKTNKPFTFLAFDGETFGHHHKFADMWAEYFPKAIHLKHAEMLTINEYLKRNPNLEYTQINENTSWSCVHGLDRWNMGCSCSNQEHNPILTMCLNSLEDEVHSIFDEKGNKIFNNPWQARLDYINLLLNNYSQEKFYKKHLKNSSNQLKAQSFLEAEYHLQLAFTSCGWFFKDISPPTKENIKDAIKVVDLINDSTGYDLSSKISKLYDFK